MVTPSKPSFDLGSTFKTLLDHDEPSLSRIKLVVVSFILKCHVISGLINVKEHLSLDRKKSQSIFLDPFSV